MEADFDKQMGSYLELILIRISSGLLMISSDVPQSPYNLRYGRADDRVP
ncbi:hypothetical protein GGR27_000519 [Lewinella antarctica]|uniref:Ycf15 n=1 Tax=Neolewinella antarctica TaxID=442734 RepID=A0ABX0X854_9BACT|nr:hypothetical protein [Neolewinella antarctica]